MITTRLIQQNEKEVNFDNLEDAGVKVGDGVMKAIGELSATAKDAAKAAAETGVDHEEVRSWLTTIIKAVMDVLK